MVAITSGDASIILSGNEPQHLLRVYSRCITSMCSGDVTASDAIHTSDLSNFSSIVPPIRTAIAFFFNDTTTTEIYTLSLHDALPFLSEEHASDLHSHLNLVCRLLV